MPNYLIQFAEVGLHIALSTHSSTGDSRAEMLRDVSFEPIELVSKNFEM